MPRRPVVRGRATARRPVARCVEELSDSCHIEHPFTRQRRRGIAGGETALGERRPTARDVTFPDLGPTRTGGESPRRDALPRYHADTSPATGHHRQVCFQGLVADLRMRSHSDAHVGERGAKYPATPRCTPNAPYALNRLPPRETRRTRPLWRRRSSTRPAQLKRSWLVPSWPATREPHATRPRPW